MKISILQRLKFAYYAFFLKDLHNIYPYGYYCATTVETGLCDNNKRISKCTNRIEVHLMQPEFKIEYSEKLNYNVCKECADKYIGTFGENFNN
jgi:hypothetical protein